MKLTINHQEHYSRLELLLRTFFGWLYIVLPHGFILFFLTLWSGILSFLAFWAVLFTGKYPKSFYSYQVNLQRWNLRLSARLANLSDGYPSFGLKATDDHTGFEMQQPEKLSRGLLILRVLFGWLYVGIPHGFILMFRGIATWVIMFIAWFIVLFAGQYPSGMHSFVTGTIRWSTRVGLYMMFMTDKYPPFTGKETE